MPCLRVFTNVDADKSTLNAFLKEASAMVAKELRKPERYDLAMSLYYPLVM
ncbi:uncharacterized protein [Blastocystis hominis]|uniref:Uncharacterized protein n=1 Tax=Blastocystis hominis TaxID=12968 RepID=D8M1J7_BLAHO|nr:uncharacterized protein [Blastocystis hominis]CBK21936.2 unnamed protein product [Blastocystis hominis]|eukprot:XP_012895984.1 uncharacterized protein [Blastocystis hominis]